MGEVSYLLKSHIATHGIAGEIYVDGGFVVRLRQDPRRLRGPDVAFVSEAKLREHGDPVEVMLYILAGHVRHEFGEGLKHAVENTAGDFIFIEPGVPHEVFNLSDTAPVVAVVAWSDASEWANIIGYDRIRGAGEAERASS